ncbi:tetratricopeptide repeat protein [Bizionia sp. KMM 8389]
MTNKDLLYYYFSNSLTKEQEHVFNERLKTDADFKLQFEFEKNLKAVIKNEESKKLKVKLQGYENELQAKNKPTYNYKYLAVAASLLILFGWFGYNTLFSTDYSNLYATNYNEYPNTVYTITRSEDENTLERQAFVAYETQNYRIALQKFDSIPEREQKEYVKFYKAQAYLGLNETKKAEQLFLEIIKADTKFVAEASWYMALIAIKDSQKEKAKVYLKKLTRNYSYNKEKAEALLEALR